MPVELPNIHLERAMRPFTNGHAFLSLLLVCLASAGCTESPNVVSPWSGRNFELRYARGGSGKPQADTILVELTVAKLRPGQSTQANATVVGTNGKGQNGKGLVWSSSNPAVATVNQNGVVTALTVGAVVIQAAMSGCSGGADLSVFVPTITAVEVSVDSATLAPGHLAKASARARDETGSLITGRPVIWTSLAPGVASVASTGDVTGISAGSAVIRGTVDGLAGQTSLTVTVPPPPPPPPPADEGSLPANLAKVNFDNGSVSPFINYWAGGDVDVVDDPTGAGKGKVARFHYAGNNQDRNRSLEFGRAVRFGQTLYSRGEFYLPSSAGMSDGNYQRKLLYWQPHKDYAKYGTNGGPTFWSIVTMFGNGLHYTGGFVAQAGGNVETMTSTIAVLSPGRWYVLEKQITLNSSASASDGVVRIWLDGRLIFEKTDMRWTDPAWGGQPYGPTALDWNDVYFERYEVGNQVNAFGPFDEYRYWDNVAFSTVRIAP